MYAMRIVLIIILFTSFAPNVFSNNFPAIVQEFKDDSTYYQRIKGVKQLFIRPTSGNVDSLVKNFKTEEQSYAKDLLHGYIAEINGDIDSAAYYYTNSLSRELIGIQNYFANLDLARISLKSNDIESAERFLEVYLDTLYFEIIADDLFWGGGTSDKLTRFLNDHSLIRDPRSQDEAAYILKEYRFLKFVLLELKKLNGNNYVVPTMDELREGLKTEGEKLVVLIMKKDINELLKYIDKNKWKVAVGSNHTLSFFEIKSALRDSTNLLYCQLFGGGLCKTMSIRESFIDTTRGKLKIIPNIFNNDYLLSPLGTLSYKWDETPDIPYFTDRYHPYFIYTKDGWKLLNLFAK